MTSDDAKIWAAYAKGVKRTYGKKAHPKRSKKVASDIAVPPSKGMTLGNTNWFPSFTKTQPETKIDRKTERAMRKGAIDIEAKIDLHGLTQEQAFIALDKFLMTQIKRGHRYLLVITGKGNKGQGVLRSKLPEWIDNIGAPLLRLAPASAQHGGDGAFYVILRRRRD